jgi:mRNA-degrading endonuclease toxin of MazEF toxin-antitoxin module
MSRGDIYLADLNPSRGSEQAGIRPVVVVQRETIDRFTQTVVIVPLTSNLRRANIPGTFTIPAEERWTHSRVCGTVLSNCSNRQTATNPATW